MDLQQFVDSGGVLLAGIASAITAVIVIINGGGRFGNWLRDIFTKPLADDLEKTHTQTESFIQKHEDYKEITDKRLEAVEDSVDELTQGYQGVQGILKKDLKDKEKHESDLRFVFECLDIMLEHEHRGNHIEQIKTMKQRLHSHILTRR